VRASTAPVCRATTAWSNGTNLATGYDFAGNAGPKNLFAYPLGPGEKQGAFQHDGGEILFSLPNGLQGYLLVDGKGNRIDKGPTAIVSDPKQADRAVVNGISCMSCHSKGTIEKEDQVRSHVEKNKNSFGAKEASTIRALYPPKDKFLGLVREDAKRFKLAVEKCGGQLGTTEPIVALASTFESEVDLPLAAAEAGLRIEEFKDAVRLSKELGRTLGAASRERRNRSETGLRCLVRKNVQRTRTRAGSPYRRDPGRSGDSNCGLQKSSA
jgi:hypothetical protein